MHGFVDESIRPGSYRLTLVLANPADLAPLTSAVRNAAPTGSRRTHLSAESHQRRRQVLGGYRRLAISAVVYRAAYRYGDNDEPARQQCMATLLGELGMLRVALIVFDTRGATRDAHDRRTISHAISVGIAPERLAYNHRGSRDDPLLALPDAIGWAEGAGGHSAQLVHGMTRRVDLP
jgi:hypothetical protein